MNCVYPLTDSSVTCGSFGYRHVFWTHFYTQIMHSKFCTFTAQKVFILLFDDIVDQRICLGHLVHHLISWCRCVCLIIQQQIHSNIINTMFIVFSVHVLEIVKCGNTLSSQIPLTAVSPIAVNRYCSALLKTCVHYPVVFCCPALISDDSNLHCSGYDGLLLRCM